MTSIFIEFGQRYLSIDCIAIDLQCCHELANDKAEFTLEKLSTRYWCNETHCKCFGDYGYHILQTNSVIGIDFGQQDVSNEDKTTDNFKEGATKDLDSNTVTATGAVKNDRSTPSILYNKLTTSFQFLAEDIPKSPDLANMLHGFIIKVQQVLCDPKSSNIKQ